MNPNQLTAFQNLQQAQKALKSGDTAAARQLANQALLLAPEMEEVWLLKAALASPRDSVAYLDKALKINPNSERAKKGLTWALKRLQQEAEAAPAAVVAGSEPSQKSETPAAQPESVSEIESSLAVEAEPTPTPAPTPAVVQPARELEPVTHQRFSYATLLTILVFLVLAWVAWSGVTPAAAFFTSEFTVREHGPSFAQVNLARPAAVQPAPAAAPVPTLSSLAQSNLPVLISPTPTATSYSSMDPASTLTEPAVLPTDTDIPPLDPVVSPTFTALPSDTPVGNPRPVATAADINPTNTAASPTAQPPAPSETPLPTDIGQPTTAAGDGSASPTPLPTDTAIPGGSQPKQPTPIPLPSPVNNNPGGFSGRWVDVDLTHQMVYAYDGNSVVRSFLVSTGTRQYPTVTGQYRIYSKYRYKDMSGPGYFLPNVPFTMFFYQGYALHGTYWHHNFGTPMSHGCVNLSIPDSEWLYSFASVGTLVNVHY